MKKILTAILASSLTFSCAAETSEIPPDPNLYHWANGNLNPTFKNLTTGYNVRQAVAAWNGLNTPVQLKETVNNISKIEIIEGGGLNSGWLGRAQTHVIQDHIVGGTVIINTALINDKHSDLANIKMHILCHEIGHSIGLNHVYDRLDSCMNDCTETDDWEECINHPDGTSPNQQDRERLLMLYDGHSDENKNVGRRVIVNSFPR